MTRPPLASFSLALVEAGSLPRRAGYVLLVLVVILGSADRSLGAPVYYSLPFSGQTTDLSSDGRVVVGYLGQAGQEGGAIRWTASGGVQRLTTQGQARGVSADGSVVAGHSSDIDDVGNRSNAFRWTAASGLTNVFDVGNVKTYGISDDGATIVGDYNDNGPRPFAWSATSGGRTLPIPNEQHNTSGSAYAIAGDGSSAVGLATFPNGRFGQLSRWTLNPDSNQALSPETNLFYPTVVGVSGDGSVIVGNELLNPGWYWTSSMGYQRVPGQVSAVSPDGRYVAYYSNYQTYLFDRVVQGSIDLGQIFVDEGLPDLRSSGFSVNAISGNAIQGYNFTGGVAPWQSVPSPYLVRGVMAGSASVPEIDPAGIGSVAALLLGALGLAERRVAARVPRASSRRG